MLSLKSHTSRSNTIVKAGAYFEVMIFRSRRPLESAWIMLTP